MKITDLNSCPRVPVVMEGAWGAERQVPVGRSDGAPGFSARVFTIAPGGNTPHHQHPFEHVNYIIEGEGELVGDEGPRAVRKGDFVLVLPDEKHQYRNTGTEPLVFICLVPSAYE